MKYYSKALKAALLIACVDMTIFATVKTLVFIEYIPSTRNTRGIEYMCFLLFIPLFFYIMRQMIRTTKKMQRDHIEDLQHRKADDDKFINSSSIISVADKNGKITYVNEKFEKISGWTLEEVIGKDHSIVNSGTQPDGYWGQMYSTVLKGEIWNDVVTNRAKDGSIYYVDTYIRAMFDKDGNLEGFSSIRQDVTDIIKSSMELERKELQLKNRMTAINRSNAVIEFDLDGNIKFANSTFIKALGYSLEELVGKHHSMLVFEEDKNSRYDNFWEMLKNGEFFGGEVVRRRKDGSRIYLQATYNPIIGEDGKPYRILKVATDISLSIQQQHEIEKKVRSLYSPQTKQLIKNLV